MEVLDQQKANALLNLIKKQDDDNLIDKIILYAKGLNELKYQFIIKKREDIRIKHLNDPKAFIEYSQYMDDVYNNINDYNPNKKRNILIVFDDMTGDIMWRIIYQMQKIEYVSCTYHTILFFCSKRS